MLLLCIKILPVKNLLSYTLCTPKMTAIDKPSELNLLIIRFPRGSESEYTANFSPKSNQKIFIHGVIDVNKVSVMRWI